MRRIETYDWWGDLVQDKDRLSLRELADKYSVTPGAISAAFKRVGLSRVPAPPGPRAFRPDRREQAASEDPYVRPGSKDVLIRPFLQQLGRLPDADIAKRAGVSVRTIASYRARHNISGYRGPRRSTKVVSNGTSDANLAGSMVFSVTLRTDDGQTVKGVVAEGLDDALDKARTSYPGQVIGVGLVGPLL